MKENDNQLWQAGSSYQKVYVLNKVCQRPRNHTDPWLSNWSAAAVQDDRKNWKFTSCRSSSAMSADHEQMKAWNVERENKRFWRHFFSLVILHGNWIRCATHRGSSRALQAGARAGRRLWFSMLEQAWVSSCAFSWSFWTVYELVFCNLLPLSAFNRSVALSKVINSLADESKFVNPLHTLLCFAKAWGRFPGCYDARSSVAKRWCVYGVLCPCLVDRKWGDYGPLVGRGR